MFLNRVMINSRALLANSSGHEDESKGIAGKRIYVKMHDCTKYDNYSGPNYIRSLRYEI